MKKFIVVTCLLYAGIEFASCIETDNNSLRNSRFIAALVSFPNEQCTVNNDIGVCFSSKKCTRMGGRNLGTCAHGYGSCCKFTAQCTTSDTVTVTRNQTTLITPPTFPTTCTFNFPKLPGVCQIRLDFTRFGLQQPNADANCDVDSMTISGTVTTEPLTVCGTLDMNEHMYLDYGSTNGPIQVAITTNGNSMMVNGPMNGAYGYEIRTTQIKCNSERRVPADCLQYYRNQTGIINSFNFPQRQLNNEDYRICVEKRNPGDQIQWKLCDPMMMPNMPDPNNFCIVGRCGSPAPGGSCGTDYLEIPKSSQGRYCQVPFPRSITTDDFWIRVNFDQNEPTGDSPIISYPAPEPPICSGNTFITPPGYYAFQLVGGNCVSTPKNTVPDISNTGFCLMYSVVSSSVPEGDDPPPMNPAPPGGP